MLLSNQQLREWLNIKQNSALIRWLNDNQVAWWLDGKRRPVTTLEDVRGVNQQAGEVEL